MKLAKRLMQSAFRRMGYAITRVHTTRSLGPFEIARTLIKERTPVIFDVGANVGQTIIELRSTFPSAEIHCFEPFPESFDRLASAVTIRQPAHAHAIALSDRTGVATFSVNASSQTNSLLPTDRSAEASWGSGLLSTVTTIEVPTTTIDTFCREHSLYRIDLLKIDAQGAEYSILQGASEMLGRRAINVLLFEILIAPTYAEQRRASEYFTLLDSYGYEFRGFFRPLYGETGEIAQADVLFALPDDRSKEPS